VRAISFQTIVLLALSPVAPAVAGWMQLGGTEQPIVELTLDPVRPGVLYARVITELGLEEAYLWTSADGGQTWRSLQPGLLRPSSALAVDPTDTRVLWAWTPESQGVFQGELWRSGDGGTTWERRYASPPTEVNHDVLQLLSDPADPQTLFRLDGDADGTRVAVTRDGGATFAAGSPVPGGSAVLVFHPQRREIFAFSGAGLVASADGGRTWQVRGTYRQLGLATGVMAPSAPDRLYAIPSARPSGISPCLVGSLDAGARWTRLNTPVLPALRRCEAVAVDPAAAEHLWLTATAWTPGAFATALVESTDGGHTWSLPRPLPSPYLVVVAGVGGELYAQREGDFTSAGLYRSADGGRTWSRRDTALAAGDLRFGLAAVRRADGSTRVVAIGQRGLDNALFASIDGGARWKGLSPGEPVSLVAAGGRVLLAVTAGGSGQVLLRSTDAGASWEPVPGAPPRPSGFVPAPQGFALEVDAVRPEHVATASFDGSVGIAGSVTPWLTDDRGATWRPSASGLPVDCWHVASVDYCPALYAYAADPFGSSRRWLSFGVPALFSNVPTLFVSDDAGATWRAPAEQPASPYTYLTDPSISGRLLAGTVAGVYESTDGGEHWHPLGLGLPANTLVHQLLRDGASGALYAATVGRGIFRSGDAGATWAELSGEPDVEPPLLALDGSTLLTAFRGQGVWRWTP
jgi:photosystem II stability/assembly factor-like uncharacterized protein